MSNQKLALQVVLDVLNKASKPLRQINKDSGATAETLRKTRDQLKTLQQQQRNVQAFHKTRLAISQQSKSIEKNNAILAENKQKLEKQQQAHDIAKANLRATEKQYRRLTKAMYDGADSGEEFRKELQKAQISLHSQQQTFEKSSSALKKYKGRIWQAQKQIKQLSDNQIKSKHNLEIYRQKLEKSGHSTNKLAMASKRLRKEEQLTTAELAKQKRVLEQLNKQKHLNRQRKERLDKIRKNGMTIGGHGAVGAFAGQQALSGMFGFLQPGIAFEEQMSAVQAVTRLQKEDPRYQMLQKQAAHLGETTSFTAFDVASGQEFLARAGFSPEAINSSMADVLALAKANRVELGRSADIVSNIAGTFKIDAEVDGNIRGVADLLTATATRANVNLEMLGETMKYLGQAEGLNLSIEQAAAMAGMLGNIGIQGSEAGTTLRAMLTRLAAPTGEAQEALADLDVQVADSAGNLRQLPELLADIYKASKNMGNVERTGYLKAIFGEEPGSGMAQLIDQQGEAGITKFVDILKNVQGENRKAANTMANNTAGDLLALNSAWQTISGTLLASNNTPMRNTIKELTDIVRGVNQWMQANPELTATLVKFAAIGAVVLTVLGTLGIMLGGTMMLFGGLARILPLASLSKTGGLIKGLGKGLLWLGKTALPTVFTALRTFSLFIMGTPIGWLIAGLTALAAAIVYYWEPISGFFKGLGKGVAMGLAPLQPVFDSLLNALSPLGSALGWIADRLSPLFSLLQPLIDLFRLTEDSVSTASQAGTQFGIVIGSVLTTLITLPAKVLGAFFGLGQNIGSALHSITQKVSNWSPIESLKTRIQQGVQDLKGQIPAQFQNIANWITGGLKSGFNNKLAELKAEITGIAGKASGWFKEALGIRSPSRVFKGHGNDVIAGLTQGLGENKQVLTPVTDISKKLKKAGAGLALGTVALPAAALSIDTPELPHIQPLQQVVSHVVEPLQDLQGKALYQTQLAPFSLPELQGKARFNAELGAITQPLTKLDPGSQLPALQSPQPIQLDTRPPLQAKAPAPQDNSLHIGEIHIHPAPGMDEQALAQLVAKELAKLQQQQQRKKRSRLQDED